MEKTILSDSRVMLRLAPAMEAGIAEAASEADINRRLADAPGYAHNDW